MIPKGLRDISVLDLDALLASKVEESRTLDYKSDLVAGRHTDLLEDVSAMGNTSGGDIVIGVTAIDGIPESYSPLRGPPDEAILAWENALRDGLEPRLLGVEFQPISVLNGFVYVVRVPKSLTAPHRVISTRRFMARNSRGNYPLDVGELRTAFVSAAEVAESIRSFRAGRLMRLRTDEAPAYLPPTLPVMALHLIPLSAFTSGAQVEVRRIDTARQLPVIGHTSEQYRRNLDGMLSFYGDSASIFSLAYTQLFSNGIIEAAVAAATSSDKKEFYSGWFELKAIKAIHDYLALYKQLGVGTPIYLFLSLIGLRGWRMPYAFGPFKELTDPFDRDAAMFPEMVLPELLLSIPQHQAFIDRVWQAFGHAEAHIRLKA